MNMEAEIYGIISNAPRDYLSADRHDIIVRTDASFAVQRHFLNEIWGENVTA